MPVVDVGSHVKSDPSFKPGGPGATSDASGKLAGVDDVSKNTGRTTRFPATRWYLPGILTFAAVSRLFYYFGYRTDPFARYLIHDAKHYHEWAAALASGQSWEPGAFYQSPLYPYLVAAIYRLTEPTPVAPLLLQLILSLLTIFLIFRIGARAYGKPSGLLAAAIAALYGPLVFYETKLLPASIAVFLAALLVERMQAADAAGRDAGWLLAGMVLGLTALANPGFLLMGLFGSVWLVLDRSRPLARRFVRLVCFGLGAGLLILPVTIRNYRASGEWVLISSNGGITFYQGNNPNALGVFSTPPGFSGSIFTQREESRTLAEEQTGRVLGDGEISTFYFAKGMEFLGESPIRATRLAAKKILFALANEEQPLEYNVRLDENPFRWFFPIPFAVVLALASLRGFASRGEIRSRRREHPILILMAVELITLLGFYVSGRYRLPLMPALAAVAGFGAISMIRNDRSAVRRVAGMASTGALIAVCSFAYVPLVQSGLRNQQTAMSYLDRASALWDAGRREEAIETSRRSIALDPVFADRYLYLARLLYEAGRIGEAEDTAREAVRRDPGFTEAVFFVGVLCVEQGRFEEAASAFRDVFDRDTANDSSANNLLGVLLHLGRGNEALEVWREMRRRGLRVDPSLDERVRALDGAAH
jgi:pentatricopeptide repeat protein